MGGLAWSFATLYLVDIAAAVNGYPRNRSRFPADGWRLGGELHARKRQLRRFFNPGSQLSCSFLRLSYLTLRLAPRSVRKAQEELGRSQFSTIFSAHADFHVCLISRRFGSARWSGRSLRNAWPSSRFILKMWQRPVKRMMRCLVRFDRRHRFWEPATLPIARPRSETISCAHSACRARALILRASDRPRRACLPLSDAGSRQGLWRLRR
jgi:hypothetical protein